MAQLLIFQETGLEMYHFFHLPTHLLHVNNVLISLKIIKVNKLI